MYKRCMRLVPSLALLTVAFVQPFSHAGQDDFLQDLKVVAQKQFVDGKNKTSVFQNDVLITQGSLTIDADEVEVIATFGEGKEVIIARGAPAIYTQKLDDGSDVKAQANEIRYERETRTITLTGGAELQQNSSMVTGDSIVFDIEKEQLIAEGSEENDGRVTTIFRPDATNSDKKDEQEQP